VAKPTETSAPENKYAQRAPEQRQEVLRRLELRVVLGDGEQPTERRAQGLLGLQVGLQLRRIGRELRRELRPADRGARFGDRLECLLELPKGKVLALVDHSDVVRAKEILGGHTCIIGTAPHSLKFAPLQEVEAYYTDLIKVCRKGGGFMLNISFPDKATTETFKAMLDSVRECGTY